MVAREKIELWPDAEDPSFGVELRHEGEWLGFMVFGMDVLGELKWDIASWGADDCEDFEAGVWECLPVEVFYDGVARDHGAVWLVTDYAPVPKTMLCAGQKDIQCTRAYFQERGAPFVDPEQRGSPCPVFVFDGYCFDPEQEHHYRTKYLREVTWKEEVREGGHIGYLMSCDSVALWASPSQGGDISLLRASFGEVVRRLRTLEWSSGPGAEHTEAICKVVLQCFGFEVRTIHDGTGVQGFIHLSYGGFGALEPYLWAAREAVLSDPLFQENRERMEWDWENFCLKLKR